ncbi:MAG: hypothetical protein KA165_06665 [Saprospiraceae bacterium]|nr:hypothetical protein [Saprospiraceae bacterium]
MKKLIFGFFALAILVTVFTNCKKDEADDLSGTGSVTLEFDNRAGDAALAFGTNYTNAAGETVKFSTFNYFVSNFVFVKTDGTEYVVPKDSCYFLCKHEDADSREITISGIPAGDYEEIRFIIGVDSAKSVSDIAQRTGVLDPAAGAAGMYWAWNSGYIFVKVEGTSPQAPLNTMTGENTIEYHTGLFGGKDTPTLNNIKSVEIHSHDEAAKVRRDKEAPQFHIFVDILEMFTSPTNISVAANPTSHAGAFSKTVAENYADMFKLDHVHNHE